MGLEDCLSKKPVSLKVHQLAKELNVSSKEIVARCQVEEIPDIVNHLSPVSLGLALTVREWFANAASSATTATATLDGPDASPTKVDADSGEEGGDEAPRAVAKRATKKVAAPEPVKAPAKPAAAKAPPAILTPATSADHETPAAATSATSAASAASAASATSTASAASATSTASSQLVAKRAPDVAELEPASEAPHAARKPVAEEAAKAPAAPAAAAHSAAIEKVAGSSAPAEPKPVAPAAVVHHAPSAPAAPLKPALPRMPAGLSARLAPREPDRRSEGGSASTSSPRAPMSGATGSTTRPPLGAPRTGAPTAGAAGSAGGSAPATPAAPRRVITSPPPPPASMVRLGDAPPVMNVPTRPTATGPVGPQIVSPSKTKLSGPQVIRVETPDNLPTPPPMRRLTTGTGSGGIAGRTGRTGTGAGGGAGRPDARGRGGIGSSRTGRAGDTARVGLNPTDQKDRAAAIAGAKGWLGRHKPAMGRSMGGHGGGTTRVDRKPGEVQQIHVAEPLTIKELSAATGVKAVDIIKKLFLNGKMATINSAIEREVAIDMMMELDIDLIVDEAVSAADIIEARFKDREKLDERRRAPIVTILGHVDHGKTSLLDRIRNTNIAAGEAGGITQSTRAFTVPVKAGDVDRVVTFIDTPGHEAFTAMRARGARVTDIVVLVISAVDGVMPQTIESINHAKAAGVPVVVALNKIDRPEANEATIRRVLGQLAEHELNPVEWGGTTEVIRTSATRGDGIQQLLETLDYHSELLGMKADFKGSARGTVLEASVEEGRGPVARVLIQEGCLKKGDFIVIGRGYGRVRDIVNDRGARVTEALPSTPVAISGIDELPDAGDKAYVVASLRAAEEAAEERRRIDRERELAAPKITLDNIFKHLEKQGKKELALVVKGDVQGSVEALKGMLAKLPAEEVAISVKSASAGGINEGDVTLAAATNAIVVGFNVTSSAKARQVAESKGVEIRLYEVIYDLIDDVLKAAQGMLAPELKLEVLGHAEVRQVFKISKVGAIAGCYATDGVLERNAQIRVTRNGIVIEKDRRLEQLKRFKDDAKEVRAGQECGMKIVGYDDIKVGDVLECYRTVEVRRGT